jgi:hypothetical protein
MDHWVDTVRDLKDRDVEPFVTEVICRDILRYIRTKRIRDIGKFTQRLGHEYEAFIASLALYDQEHVQHIVMDDDFWNATLKMRK